MSGYANAFYRRKKVALKAIGTTISSRAVSGISIILLPGLNAATNILPNRSSKGTAHRQRTNP
jgi:hypothetical protein